MADGKIEFKDLVEKQQILQGWNEMVSEMIKNLDKIKEATIKAGTEAAQGLKGNKMTSGDDLKKYEADINKINEAEKTFNNVKKTQADIMKAVNAATFANKAEIKELTALRERYKESIKSLNVDLKEDLALFKNGTITQKEYKDRVASTNAQIEKLKIQLRENNQAIKANTTATYAQEGSYKQLAAQYSLNKIALNSMSEEQRRGTEAGRQLEAETLSLRERMNDLQKSTGNYALQVGNYELVGKDLRLELKNLERQMMGMRRANKENTDAYRTLQNEAGKLKDIMADVRAEVRNTSSDTRKLDVAISVFTTIGSAAQVAQGAVNLLGIENKKVEESIRQMMALQVMMNGINQIRNNLQSSSVLMMAVENTRMKIQTVRTAALAAAEAARTTTMTGLNAITRATAAAQVILNAAMKPSLYMLVAAAFVGLVSVMYKGWKQARELNDVTAIGAKKWENYKKWVDSTKESISEYAAQMDKLISSFNNLGLQTISRQAEIAKWTDAIITTVSTLETMDKVMPSVGFKKLSVDIIRLAADFNNFNKKEAQNLVNSLTDMAQGINKTDKQSLLYKETLIDLITMIGSLSKAQDGNNKKTDEQTKTTEKQTGLLNELNAEISEQNKLLNEAKTVEDIRLIQEKIEGLEKLRKEYLGINEVIEEHKISMSELLSIYDADIDYLKSFIELKFAGQKDSLDKEQALLDLEVKANQERYEAGYIDLETYIKNKNRLQAKQIEIDIATNNKSIEIQKELMEVVQDATETIIESYLKRSQKKAEIMDKELEKSKEYEQQLRQLAAKGIEGSTENLAFELRKQAELEKKRQQELKRQKRLELGLSAISAYSNISKSGDKNALGKTISEITKLIAFINSVPEFAEGVIALGGRHSVTQPDDTIAKIGKGESVITAPATNAYYDQLKDMQQMRYNPLDYVELPRFSNYNADNVNFQLLKKVENLSKIIENKTEYKIDIDGLRHEIVETIKTGNTKIINKYKRPFLG